ncbi:MAG TPA: hypothetical protein VGH38_11745, partial [Bryobacteraceae bacterium]
QGAYQIGKHDSTMIQDLSEFGRRLPATACLQVSESTYIGGLQPSKLGEERRARCRQVVGKSRL